MLGRPRKPMPGNTPAGPELNPGRALSSAKVGENVKLVYVDGGKGLQHRLAELGLTPGVRFRIVAKGSPGPFIVSVKGARMMLGHGMVHRIRIASL